MASCLSTSRCLLAILLGYHLPIIQEYINNHIDRWYMMEKLLLFNRLIGHGTFALTLISGLIYFTVFRDKQVENERQNQPLYRLLRSKMYVIIPVCYVI